MMFSPTNYYFAAMIRDVRSRPRFSFGQFAGLVESVGHVRKIINFMDQADRANSIGHNRVVRAATIDRDQSATLSATRLLVYLTCSKERDKTKAKY